MILSDRLEVPRQMLADVYAALLLKNKSFFSLATGGFALKKEMLNSRRFPKMHLNLQRLLQVHYFFCNARK